MARFTFEDALAALKRALTLGIHPSLEGITALAEALGRPQDAFASVQITGTNGKTSTARIAAALLTAEGRATALYTSPELERYPERMEVAGEVVSDEEFARAVGAALEAAEQLRPGSLGRPEGFTEFELLTAAALWLFRERGVDYAVLEVGMGGRWDATSVVDPVVAAITGVGLDHTHILGDTLELIAAEKAAIIGPASAPVLGPGTAGLEPIFLERAESAHTHARAVRPVGAESPVAEELTVRFELLGRPSTPGGASAVEVRGVHADYGRLEIAAPAYQAANVATAVAVAEAALGRALRRDRLQQALASVRFPGRFELARAEPAVVVDGSHNPQAATVLAEAIADAWPDPRRRPAVLLGVLSDKEAEGIAAAIASVAPIVAVTAPASERALPPERLAGVVERVSAGSPVIYPSVAGALDALVPSAANGLVVTGSLTIAGEARRLLRDGSATPVGQARDD